MTKNEIITKAELYLDDSSELSSAEFSDLFDKVYALVLAERPWEFTKTEASATTTANAYVSLPSDFSYLTQNYNFTDGIAESSHPVVFVDDEPYRVVSWSDRRRYRDQKGVAYIDIKNSRLVFTEAPGTGKTVEYDYHASATALAGNEAPIFPERFHDVLYHGMCSDDFIIQQSDKARSYRPEHLDRYAEYLKQMAYWNAQLIQM